MISDTNAVYKDFRSTNIKKETILLSDDKLNIMEISLTKAIKWLILLVSFIMFYIQVQIAFYSLRNPPVIDSTETLNIADVDPPLITVCPLNQFNGTAMMLKYGYGFGLDRVLFGDDDKKDVYAWGTQYNLTFDKLIDNMLRVHYDFFIITLTNYNRNMNPRYEKRFYPGNGYCIDVSNYTATDEIKLQVRLNSGDIFT